MKFEIVLYMIVLEVFCLEVVYVYKEFEMLFLFSMC